MPTPSGQIGLSDVNAELGNSPSAQINMDSAPVRGLAEVPSGAISMSDLQNKSNVQYVAATGGTITTDGDFKVHTFNSSGTFTVTQAGNPAGSDTVTYWVIGGGGSGGDGAPGGIGGGGGSGGVRFNHPQPATGGLPVSATSYPITVGAGAGRETSGSPSTFSSLTGTGGGVAGGGNVNDGGPGGCGGGGRGFPGNPRNGGSGNAGSFSPPEGFPGFGGAPGQIGSGGGGICGGGPTGSFRREGGDGTDQGFGNSAVQSARLVSAPSPINGGGGGSGASNNSLQSAPGGGGGGGAPFQKGGDGQANTGGGGGGSAFLPNPGNQGGAGGSGKVVIRYKFQ